MTDRPPRGAAVFAWVLVGGLWLAQVAIARSADLTPGGQLIAEVVQGTVPRACPDGPQRLEASPDGQPAGALSGVVVFCSAGHGWTAGSSAWYLQRPLLLEMVEDYGNIEQLNCLVNYLYNAGAVVVPFRPVGYRSIEIVLDNDDPGVTFSSGWSDSSTAEKYYENNATVSGVAYRFAITSTTETATARYAPDIPQDDFYPVYCWTRDGANRVNQTYRIHHSGGTAEVVIDHARVGKGWIWLGTYYLEAGTDGYVEITNQSADNGVVIADAIRFGNGMGDVVGAGPGTISGYSREEECSRYWAESEAGINAVGLDSSIWDCCTTDGADNVGTAARWSAVMNNQGVNDDRWRRIYVEYHSNAAGCAGGPPCGAKGTVCLVSSSYPTTNQQAYATILGDKMEADMLALDDGFEYEWGARYNPISGGYGAISTYNNDNEFDATIIEVAFHDNEEDARLLRDAKVRNAVARSTLQGMIKFLSDTSIFPDTQVPWVYPPEPPERVQVIHDGSGQLVVAWEPGPISPPPPGSDGPYGHAPSGYRIYRSGNGYGFGNAVDVGDVLSATLTDVPPATTVYLRVAAYNAGGESMPSEVLAARRPESGSASVLIVNGFDRVSRQQNVIQVIPAGPMERPIARRVNSFDYVVQHATALAANDVTFDSCANEAVIDAAVQLDGYQLLVWILGEESVQDNTFDATEQALVTDYLNQGGNLFVTGTDMAYELDELGAGRSFFEDTLGGDYVGDDGDSFTVTGSGGILGDIGTFEFDEASGAPYLAEYPDRLAPQLGATPILTYVSGTGDTAGLQYDAGAYRVVMFGFPFETIVSETVRGEAMQRVVEFLKPLAPADFDRDGDVDQEDYGYLQVCLTGPNIPQTDQSCLAARLDADNDVDQADVAIFVGCMSGASVPADPHCAE